jgi:hypothetical protein
MEKLTKEIQTKEKLLLTLGISNIWYSKTKDIFYIHGCDCPEIHIEDIDSNYIDESEYCDTYFTGAVSINNVFKKQSIEIIKNQLLDKLIKEIEPQF